MKPYKSILGFHTTPRGTKDNRHSGHVGVPNKKRIVKIILRVTNMAVTTSGENRQIASTRIPSIVSGSDSPIHMKRIEFVFKMLA